MKRQHKMKTHTKIVLGATTAALVLGGAFAAVSAQADSDRGWGRHHESFGRHQAMMFDQVDANKDGRITKEEIDARRAQMLAKFDANKDGVLTLEEFQGVWNDITHQRMVRKFQRMDRDGDGKVTTEELNRPMDRMMGYLDRNDDGVIERDEMGRRGGHHHDGYGRFDGDHHGYRR